MKQEIYRIYLKQHIGISAVPCVKPEDEVLAGELVGRAAAGLSLNVHASVSGTVTQVTGEYVDILKNLPETGGCVRLPEAEPLELIKDAGLCGMGGAGFPTYVKLQTELFKGGMVIVNGAECEPILDHNIQRLKDNGAEIAEGLAIAMEITKAEKGIFAIKEKQKEAVLLLKKYLKRDMEIVLLADLYPMGEERAVIREVTGKLLDINALPSAAKAAVINLETVYRIYEAVRLRKPVISKDITVGGNIKGGTGIFLDVPVGTRVGSLLERAGGLKEDTGELILGGPFTGKRTTAEEYISKTTGGILAAMPFPKDGRNMGLLVCACGGNEERLREIAASMGAQVVGVEFCKQAHPVKGSLKCDNPGKCPGQSEKVLKLRSMGAKTLLISNCSDCSNTVMSIAPSLNMPVYHCTDGSLRAAGLKLVRKIHNKGEKTLMSMSKETLQKHLNDPAIFCCQRKKGLVISEADLEDPVIFPDLVESKLLTLSEDGLTIKEVLGKTLKADTEALTPITAGMLEGGTDRGEKAPKGEAAVYGTGKETKNTGEKNSTVFTGGNGMLHLAIDELKGLTLDIPLQSFQLPGTALKAEQTGSLKAAEPEKKDKIIRTLIQKEYQVKEVRLGDTTALEQGILTIEKKLAEKAKACNPLVKSVEIDIITPDNHHIFTNTIMDIIPIAAKVKGKLGEGETAVISGAVFCLTGLDEKGVQIHEFGSCEGYIDEKVAFGRPGCPDETDIMIRVNVVIQEGTGMERRGPFAAHCACDVVIQEIREVLKKTKEPVYQEDTFRDMHKYGRPRVVLVKEIMGQGAMHDNIICPSEPAGVPGGQKNVDLGNVPVMLSPNEVLDGGIHALTCIGPATKEMTRHYFREPLVKALARDEELDLAGVIFIGSPQVNDEKIFVTERLGALVETMALEGAIVTTEGFGNNHIDFAGNIAAIGSRGIPAVGVTFSAYQGQLVVGNQYMDAMIELNKDPEGFENEVLGCSSICAEDAKRAVLMLKTKMAGIPIESANRKWSQAVIDANQKLVK